MKLGTQLEMRSTRPLDHDAYFAFLHVPASPSSRHISLSHNEAVPGRCVAKGQMDGDCMSDSKWHRLDESRLVIHRLNEMLVDYATVVYKGVIRETPGLRSVEHLSSKLSP
jgi:hypothetical protein